MEIAVPKAGEWPVDPQEDQEISEERIWIDGCFDFFHHGHAGVMLQARQQGNELLVGIHSDEDILEHKGPTVMNLDERVLATEACRWVTKTIPRAPYVTYLPWISHYGCQYVVHGDDITSDSGGEDCYRFVKRAGRFKVVKRTPGISTTDLVGRMLLCTKNHFIRSLQDTIAGIEGSGNAEERKQAADYMNDRMKAYATDESGLRPGPDVLFYQNDQPPANATTNHDDSIFKFYSKGKGPRKGQRIIYVDGGFDLFSSGQIEFLRSVSLLEKKLATENGWYGADCVKQRLETHHEDFGPAFIIAGIHDDKVINQHKGLNYPIMNIFERGLCVLQCKYVHSVIFGAPFEPTESFLHSLPYDVPAAVYHGPTSFIPLGYDPYSEARKMGIFHEIPKHDFQDVNAAHIVDRITQSRARFEERQRKKGVKSVAEEAARKKELENGDK